MFAQDALNLPVRAVRTTLLVAVGLAAGQVHFSAGAAAAPPAGRPSSPTPAAAVALPVRHDPPAGPGAMAPNLTVVQDGAGQDGAGQDGAARDGIVLTWLEPKDSTKAQFRLRLARFHQGKWSAPQDLAQGPDFFTNWADLPALAITADGFWLAHWLHRLGSNTYAYGIRLTGSRDFGRTWQQLGLLHDDASPTEHGFVSYVPLPDGSIQVFWLDGRNTASTDGSMELRTRRLSATAAATATAPPPVSTLLDARVCDCCATDAALTSDGPILVYRDRSASEVRDISVIRAEPHGWSEPQTLHHDGWVIPGCPVNGPAIAAWGRRVAVAWFTGANDRAQVQVASSADAGKTFGAPLLIDGENPLGRVDVVLDPRGRTIVSWLGRQGENAEIRWRVVDQQGQLGPVQVVASTTTQRTAGVPRLLQVGDQLAWAWVEPTQPTMLRFALSSLP